MLTTYFFKNNNDELEDKHWLFRIHFSSCGGRPNVYLQFIQNSTQNEMIGKNRVRTI